MEVNLNFEVDMPKKQRELNEFLLARYKDAKSWNGHVTVYNEEYAGTDELINDIKRIILEFPNEDFVMSGSIDWRSEGDSVNYKYEYENKVLKYSTTNIYITIDDFIEYETPEEFFENYPDYEEFLDYDEVQELIDCACDEVYLCGRKLSAEPPKEYRRPEIIKLVNDK